MGIQTLLYLPTIDVALSQPNTELRLFGKPKVKGQRRMGVAFARGDNLTDDRQKANRVISELNVQL